MVLLLDGGGGANSPVVNQSSVTSTSGTTWYLVSSIGTNSGCTSANAAFGWGFDSTVGVCPAASVTGNLVTTIPQTQTETITGYSSSSLDQYVATQTTTQVISNGVAGPIGALTPSTPVYSLNNTGFTPSFTSSFVSDTSGVWMSGTANPNNVCTATASLPAAGATTPVLSNTVNTGTSGTVSAWSNPTGPTAGTPTTSSVSTGGVANSLADTAAYYYNTNLRTTALNNCTGPIVPPATTPSNLCASPGNVPPHGQDTATWQHMTTFTLGLGARGRMIFSPTYQTDTSGDYFDVLHGSIPSSTICTWRDTLTVAGGTCNWPVPGADQIENVDDLWHAAVNGRGNYFSATDPAQLASGLSASLNVIINVPRPGTEAAAATTNPQITNSNNFQFSSYFVTVEWSGELIRQPIDLTTHQVPLFNPLLPDPAAYDWSAKALLDAKTYTTRNIYTKGTSGLIPFDWTNLVANGLQSNFTPPNITTSPPGPQTSPSSPNKFYGLSQFCASGSCLSPTAQNNTTVATGGAAGEALVNFLRGDTSNSEVVSASGAPLADNNKFFRYRAHILGDIVASQPLYVGPPDRGLSDANYDAYVAANVSRQSMVLVGANDGMLHAFDSNTGQEMWAYIPSFELPRLYTLADKNYGASTLTPHQYFVEGSPRAYDICWKAPAGTCNASEWKTILVGGLNGGGRGYYALDITNPAVPVFLWEFTDPNMGYTFGNSQIVKLDDGGASHNGTWVALLTSGYENCPYNATLTDCVKNGTGDGIGYLYVLNAYTGAPIASTPTTPPVSTGIGSTTAPSGLSRITAHTPNASLGDNTATHVYGGDLYGNLWRFTIGTGGYTSQLLATFMDNASPPNPQPITARPQVTTVNGSPVVYVGTGKYLGNGDVGSTLQQSFYAVKDLLNTTSFGSPRANSTFMLNTAVDTVCPGGTSITICQPGQVVRTVTATTSGDSLANKNGWVLDFPANSGEIQFTDPTLVLGTIVFTTSVPKVATLEVCTPKNTGSEGDSFLYMLDYATGNAIGTTVAGTSLGAGVATAPQVNQYPDGKIEITVRTEKGDPIVTDLRVKANPAVKRLSWRELF